MRAYMGECYITKAASPIERFSGTGGICDFVLVLPGMGLLMIFVNDLI